MRLKERIDSGAKALEAAGFAKTWGSLNGQRQTWQKREGGRKFVAHFNAGSGRVNVNVKAGRVTLHTGSVIVYRNHEITAARLGEAIRALKEQL